MSNDERRSRSFRVSTILLWSAAVILAIAGMAFDARGSFTLSVICFLAASVALVAPLVSHRRREASDSEPVDP